MLASVAMARRGWQLVAVFVLALAVVGMHSLGAGHHGATTTVGHGSHLTAGAEVEADDHLPATSSGMDHHAAEKAAETHDPQARLFYRGNAIRDYETAIRYLAHDSATT